MAITDTLKSLIGTDESGVEVTTFECGECGHTFESAKTADRAQCMECLSNDVRRAD